MATNVIFDGPRQQEHHTIEGIVKTAGLRPGTVVEMTNLGQPIGETNITAMNVFIPEPPDPVPQWMLKKPFFVVDKDFLRAGSVNDAYALDDHAVVRLLAPGETAYVLVNTSSGSPIRAYEANQALAPYEGFDSNLRGSLVNASGVNTPPIALPAENIPNPITGLMLVRVVAI